MVFIFTENYTHKFREKTLKGFPLERERDWTKWRIYYFIPFCAVEILCQWAWIAFRA